MTRLKAERQRPDGSEPDVAQDGRPTQFSELLDLLELIVHRYGAERLALTRGKIGTTGLTTQNLGRGRHATESW
jgi:hypothetical protein